MILILNILFQSTFINLIPDSIVISYKILLILIEPIIVYYEIKLIFKMIYKSGHLVANFVYEVTNENIIIKVIIVIAASTIYGSSLYILYRVVFQVQSHLYTW